jgi:triosephosphate isomerase
LSIPARIEAIVCPDFLSLPLAAKTLPLRSMKLGSQDAAFVDRGAYTGEISPADIKSLGASYVILGHSERRQYLGETDVLINKKLQAVLAVSGLTPVLCVGEKIRGKNPKAVLHKQLAGALKNVKLKPGQRLVVAYEPVWAIGTGRVIKRSEVVLAHLLILGWLTKRFSPAQCQVLYGGSVDAKNAANFSDISVVDGLLVGGASLDPKSFLTICRSMLK